MASDRKDYIAKVDGGDCPEAIHGLFNRTILLISTNDRNCTAMDQVLSAQATIMVAVMRESVSRLDAMGLGAIDCLRNSIRSALIAAAQPLASSGRPIPVEFRAAALSDFANELARAHTLAQR